MPAGGTINLIGKFDCPAIHVGKGFMPARKKGKTRNRARKASDRVSLARQKLKVALGPFAQRFSDLILAYMAVGRLTPGLRRKALRLKSDIEKWRERTGKASITAQESSKRHPARKISAAMTKGGCGYCDPIMFERWRVCFLVDCDPRYRECDYVCIGVLVAPRRRPMQR